jgi:hypothetical protein
MTQMLWHITMPHDGVGEIPAAVQRARDVDARRTRRRALEAPRTGVLAALLRGHDEYTPQELVGGRS